MLGPICSTLSWMSLIYLMTSSGERLEDSVRSPIVDCKNDSLAFRYTASKSKSTSYRSFDMPRKRLTKVPIHYSMCGDIVALYNRLQVRGPQLGGDWKRKAWGYCWALSDKSGEAAGTPFTPARRGHCVSPLSTKWPAPSTSWAGIVVGSSTPEV